MTRFPEWFDAPVSLLRIEGNCGLLSIWAILKYFGKRTNSEKLIKSAHHTKKNGVFGIGAAVSLAAHGLGVTFFGDEDREPHRTEIRLYRLAQELGVEKKNGVSLPSLLKQISGRQIGLVLYDKPSGAAHLSPLLGVKKGNLVLPYETEQTYSMKEFNRVWNKMGILRQAILVSRKDD